MYTVGAFLIRGEWSLMEKIYKTQTERIDLLVKRGMTIEKSSKKILEKYSHYNLINAYKNPFLENKVRKNRFNNLKLVHILLIMKKDD